MLNRKLNREVLTKSYFKVKKIIKKSKIKTALKGGSIYLLVQTVKQ